MSENSLTRAPAYFFYTRHVKPARRKQRNGGKDVRNLSDFANGWSLFVLSCLLTGRPQRTRLGSPASLRFRVKLGGGDPAAVVSFLVAGRGHFRPNVMAKRVGRATLHSGPGRNRQEQHLGLPPARPPFLANRQTLTRWLEGSPRGEFHWATHCQRLESGVALRKIHSEPPTVLAEASR